MVALVHLIKKVRMMLCICPVRGSQNSAWNSRVMGVRGAAFFLTLIRPALDPEAVIS